jgi:hypothetical protein
MQEETGDHLTNHLTWIPYVVTLFGCVLVVGFSIWAIFSEQRRMKRRQKTRDAERAAAEVVS